MCTLKKSNNIVLENGAYILATASTLLLGNKDSGHAIFLNNYNFGVYAFEVFGIRTLTGNWVFIASSKLIK